MASVSTTIERVELGSVVSGVMTRVIEDLPKEQKATLLQWIEEIENAAQKLMPDQMKKREPETVAAAAVYDAFLQFESRTNIKVGLTQLHRAIGRSACSINTAWKRLFDKRVYLQGDKLEMDYRLRRGTALDVIPNVMQILKEAAKEQTPEVIAWLTEIEKDAIELTKTVATSASDKYDAALVAVTVIYSAVQRYHGKPIVVIGQKDLSLLAVTSPAMISKCWLEFFGPKKN